MDRTSIVSVYHPLASPYRISIIHVHFSYLYILLLFTPYTLWPANGALILCHYSSLCLIMLLSLKARIQPVLMLLIQISLCGLLVIVLHGFNLMPSVFDLAVCTIAIVGGIFGPIKIKLVHIYEITSKCYE